MEVNYKRMVKTWAVSIYNTQKMKWCKLWIIRIYIHQSTTEDSESMTST